TFIAPDMALDRSPILCLFGCADRTEAALDAFGDRQRSATAPTAALVVQFKPGLFDALRRPGKNIYQRPINQTISPACLVEKAGFVQFYCPRFRVQLAE